MSKGYIAIAQNNDRYDYLKMAYAMALSLKATQKVPVLLLLTKKDKVIVFPASIL